MFFFSLHKSRYGCIYILFYVLCFFQDNSNLVWCKVCVMSFINEKTYQKHCRSNSHLQNTDPDKLKLKEFVCEKCGLGFKNKDTLTSHHNRMHKNKGMISILISNY